MITLYGRANSSNVQKALWLFAELALPCRRIDVGGPFGGLDAPAFRALNPNGAIPVVVDGPLVLWESHAILRHYARAYPAARLAAEDLAGLARADMTLDWLQTTLWPPLRAAYQAVERRGAPNAAPEVRAALGEVEARLPTLAALQAGAPWLSGARFGVADIAAAVVLARWRHLGRDLAAWPSLDVWFDRCAARPAYAAEVRVGG